MPIQATQPVDVPARKLDLWILGPVVLGNSPETGKLTAITTMKRGDASGPSISPADAVELRSMDLVGEFLGDEKTGRPVDVEALQAIQAVTSGIELLAGKLMDLRGIR